MTQRWALPTRYTIWRNTLRLMKDLIWKEWYILSITKYSIVYLEVEGFSLVLRSAECEFGNNKNYGIRKIQAQKKL